MSRRGRARRLAFLQLGFANIAQNAEAHPLEPLVRWLGRHSEINDGDRVAVHALRFDVAALGCGEYIARKGDVRSHCSLLLSGFAVGVRTVEPGFRQIVSIGMAGDFLDGQHGILPAADQCVRMISAGEVARIARGDLERLAIERPQVARAMWAHSIVDTSIAREWMANLGRRDARARIAHLLCELAFRLDVVGERKRIGYALPLKQDEIADATGLTPVHVNRTLMALEQERLIERPRPRSILVPDWRKLAQVGAFDPAYLHLKSAGPGQH